MTQQIKDEIVKISKEFAQPFYSDIFNSINGTGFYICDPLSGFLNFSGFKNKLSQIPDTKNHPQVMIMTFEDGTKFIPAGGDLKDIHPAAENWLWID